MNTHHADDQIVILPETRNISGASFRHFRGEEDYPLILSILISSKTADNVERSDSLEELVNNYTHLVNCDLATDLLFVEIHGEPAGYIRVEWKVDGEGNYSYFHIGFVKGESRNLGIGRALLHWGEKRLRTLSADHPKTVKHYFDTFTDGNQKTKISLLESEGYQVIRSFYRMVRPDLENIPQANLPSAIEIRPVSPENYRKVWNALTEAFKDHWGFTPPSEEDFEAWQKSRTFQPDLWKVAWSGDQVIGTVLGYIDEDENKEYGFLRGWTESITVQRAWRGKGIAKALIAENLRMLKDLGMQQAALGVDTQNLSGATRLYESMGFRPVHTSMTHRKYFEV
jgi:mycothiol synthase